MRGVLHRLKEKAVRAFTQHKSNNTSIQHPIDNTNSLFLPSPVDDVDDDLAIFGGQTRVLSRKSRHKRTALSTSGIPDPPSPGSSKLSAGVTETNDSAALPSPVASIDVQSATTMVGAPSSLQDVCDVPILGSYTTGFSNNGNVADGAMELSPPLNRNEVSPASVPQSNDIFSNMMGYTGSKPAVSPAVSPSNLSMYEFAQGLQGFPDLQEWQGLSPDANGLPKPDNSFNWLPPSPQPDFDQQQPQQPQVSSNANAAPPHLYNQTTSTTQQMFPPDHSVQAKHSPSSSYPDGNHFPVGYKSPLVPTGYESSTDMITDQTETLLELGLMRGSDIDSGWMSFMRDCGIMDTSSEPSSLSYASLSAP
ncbi:hypothetical protein C0993_006426 [Termitomyces sp. T159_Od127]|nr:hypothetical protein C0993_006426 [Termitomyces sp. T159_Od127]